MGNLKAALSILEAFNTGASSALKHISDERYIQHNPSFADGKAAVVPFFRDEPLGVKLTVHRAFEDGEYVVAHSTYGGGWNEGTPQVAFDVFRFDNGIAVEHWDNLLNVAPANPSGRTQTDGDQEIVPSEDTATNKAIVSRLMLECLIGGDYSRITEMISPSTYLQHNPAVADGLQGFNEFVASLQKTGTQMEYTTCPLILGCGNFVLTGASGTFGSDQVAYYDLWRLEERLVVEHWDVVSPVPPRAEWANPNDKF